MVMTFLRSDKPREIERRPFAQPTTGEGGDNAQPCHYRFPGLHKLCYASGHAGRVLSGPPRRKGARDGS